MSPIVISIEEHEESSEVNEPNHDHSSHDSLESEHERFSLEEEALPLPKSQSLENLYIPERTVDHVVDEEERQRCRSAMLQKVKKNELTRKKMNELRLLQAKLKREEEKQRHMLSNQ